MNKVATFLLIALLLLAGCSVKNNGESSSGTRHKNQLIYASSIDFDKINPILDKTNADALIFRGLMKFDHNNKPRKDIAKSYHVSDNGRMYNFKLKKGVKFQDGTELTAQDVAFTLNSILDDDVASKMKYEFDEVKSVKAVNDHEVKITLKEPMVSFLDQMTIGIVPKHAFKDNDINHADFNHHPIGAGPYKLSEWKQGKSLTLKAFKNYGGDEPHIKTVIFKNLPDSNVRALQLKTGEVDVAYLEPNQVKKIKQSGKVNVKQFPAADYRSMTYNMKKNLWQDVRVRKAFNYAVDRKSLVKGILKGYGTPAYSPLQANQYNDKHMKKYAYNPNKAKKLLDQAGWKPSSDGVRKKDGKKLSFTITAPSTDEVRVNMADFLASEFKKIGADVKVNSKGWSAINVEDTDAFMLGGGSPFDADENTYKVYHTGQADNWNHYSNAKVDRLLEKGRSTRDAQKRKKVYHRFQRELAKDPSVNPLVYIPAVYGFNTKIHGIKEKQLGHHGANLLYELEDWTMDD